MIALGGMPNFGTRVDPGKARCQFGTDGLCRSTIVYGIVILIYLSIYHH